MILIEFPKESKDLIESISFLKESFSDIMKIINNRVAKFCENRDFASMEKYIGIAKEINAYEDYLNHIVAKSNEKASKEFLAEQDEVMNNTDMSDDITYQVDHKAEHTLNEDFTHIRPYGFRFRNKTYICKTWKEILLKTCEALFMLNKNRFVEFANIRNTNGLKPKCFSAEPNNLRKPESICGAIYVETNLSSNSIRYLIIQMLKEFGFMIEDYLVYFRADYRKNNQ